MLQDQPGTLTALSAEDADGQDGSAFAMSEALKALVFFAGGDLNDLPAITQQELIDAVRAVDGLPTLRRISQELS